MGPNDAADSVTAAQGRVMIGLAPFADTSPMTADIFC